MKNRTIYEVLDSVMENYTYTIEKCGKKVTLNGKVYIKRIDVEVTHEKVTYLDEDINANYNLERTVNIFKEELRGKVAEVIKSHAKELTDDDAMIERLIQEVKVLQSNLKDAEAELKEARDKITKLELEKTLTQPYIPWAPATGTTYPWITWETPYIGDPPDWMDKTNITCSVGDGGISTTYGTGDEVRFDASEHRKRNPKRFG